MTRSSRVLADGWRIDGFDDLLLCFGITVRFGSLAGRRVDQEPLIMKSLPKILPRQAAYPTWRLWLLDISRCGLRQRMSHSRRQLSLTPKSFARLAGKATSRRLATRSLSLTSVIPVRFRPLINARILRAMKSTERGASCPRESLSIFCSDSTVGPESSVRPSPPPSPRGQARPGHGPGIGGRRVCDSLGRFPSIRGGVPRPRPGRFPRR